MSNKWCKHLREDCNDPWRSFLLLFAIVGIPVLFQVLEHYHLISEEAKYIGYIALLILTIEIFISWREVSEFKHVITENHLSHMHDNIVHIRRDAIQLKKQLDNANFVLARLSIEMSNLSGKG